VGTGRRARCLHPARASSSPAPACLRLLEVVPDDGQPVGAQEVAVHQLPRGVHVTPQPDPQQCQPLARREEVAPLEEAGHVDAAQHGEAQFGEGEAHQVDLERSLRRTEPAHDHAPARGDLLVPRVHQVAQRLERVRGREAGVAPRGGEAHGRVDEDGVDQLPHGHVLQHAPLIVVPEVRPVGRVHVGLRVGRRDLVRERAHRQVFQLDAGAHVGVDAVGQNVAHGQDLWWREGGVVARGGGG
jgi:hypothetical protein